MRAKLITACGLILRHAVGCAALVVASAGRVYGPGGGGGSGGPTQITHAPEIDLGTIAGGVALLVGGLLLASDWFGAKRRMRLP